MGCPTLPAGFCRRVGFSIFFPDESQNPTLSLKGDGVGQPAGGEENVNILWKAVEDEG